MLNYTLMLQTWEKISEQIIVHPCRIVLITCCKSKELERDKEETKREFRGNSDDFYFMLIRPIYRLIVRRPKAFT